jgi:microcystin-dependent protein
MDPFVGEIRGFGFNFVPRGWIPCDGRLLPIQQYTALFSILGVNYGGNGQTTFAVPNLTGTTMVSAGQGSGLQNWVIGEVQGTETVTLNMLEMPAHNHPSDAKIDSTGNTNMHVIPQAGDQLSRFALGSGPGGAAYTSPPNTAPVLLAATMVQPAGGGMPHQNMQPYLTLLWGIANDGVYPPRN